MTRKLFLTLAILPALTAQDVYTRIQSISAQAEQSRAKYKIPGVSIAVFRNYQLEWARTFGEADPSHHPVEPITLFQAASISKTLAATAVMRLVEQGRLNLDTNVNQYLKTWKLPENELTRKTPVTLRLIMSHTAGLTIHGFPGYAAGIPLPTLPQVLDGKPPANTEAVRVTVPPGTKFEYSGGGYTILQQLLMDVTGKPFPEIMRELVLDPVGMDISTYQQPLPESAVSIASSPEKGRHIYPEMAAAGLSTTPIELSKFAIAIQKSLAGQPGALLPRDLARLMTTESIPGSFGLGFELAPAKASEKRFFLHSGGNFGYRCLLQATLQGGNGVVVMTNGDEFKGVSEIVARVVDEYHW